MFPGAGGYLVHRGEGRETAIDWDAPVAGFGAGLAAGNLPAGLVHLEDVDYWYGMRAVSDAGVLEEGIAATCRVRIEAGVLLGPPPNALLADRCRVQAASGGRVSVIVGYDGARQRGVATAVQIAELAQVDDSWGELLQTINLAMLCRLPVTLAKTWSEGQVVRLAARAVTAAGATGPATILNPVVAKVAGPPDVSALFVTAVP